MTVLEGCSPGTPEQRKLVCSELTEPSILLFPSAPTRFWAGAHVAVTLGKLLVHKWRPQDIVQHPQCPAPPPGHPWATMPGALVRLEGPVLPRLAGGLRVHLAGCWGAPKGLVGRKSSASLSWQLCLSPQVTSSLTALLVLAWLS